MFAAGCLFICSVAMHASLATKPVCLRLNFLGHGELRVAILCCEHVEYTNKGSCVVGSVGESVE